MDGDMSARQPANTPAQRESPPDEHAVVSAPRSSRGDRHRAAFAASPVGMVLCDGDGNVVETNPALRRLVGRTDDAGAGPLDAATVHDLFPPEQADELLQMFEVLARHGSGRSFREQRQLLTRGGEPVWTFLAVAALGEDAAEPPQFLVTVEESSELQLLQDRLHHQSLYDALTGLPNRQYFRTHLENALANLEPGATLTLYHLGLEALELINNGLGPEVGDAILRTAAGKLQGLVANEDAFLARLGGAEFALLLRHGPSTPRIDQMASLVNEELAEPIYLDDHGVATSASIGVNCTSTGETTADDMMWAAEVALRRAEAAGRRQWALFDPDRAPEERTDARLAAIIPGALELGGFQITYRPVLSMAGRRLALLWAQLNWCSQERGWLDHAQCLELAERSGVTLSLRDWMLHAAWEQTQIWHTAGYRPKVLVDLSGNQTHDPDLIAAVRSVLRDTDLPPQWLWLSVPMRALTHDEEARENLALLAEIGISVVVHGFTGSPTELRHLRELPINVVRLDSELVELVHHDPDDEAPEVRAVAELIPLINACGPRVGIDGVRTEEQARRWRAMGSSFGAGDLYGAPIPVEDVAPFLHGAELSE